MSAIAIGQSKAPPKPEVRAMAIQFLIGIGPLTLAAVMSISPERPVCQSFAIGISAIGGCDWIGR